MMDTVTVTGYVAASLVGATFYMKSMVSLRSFAIASNVCFIVYAYCSSPQLYPILILHVFLLPLNAHRLWHLKRNRQGGLNTPYRREMLVQNANMQSTKLF